MAERAPAVAPERPLREGVDYTLDGHGRWVFTAGHLKARGYCCFQACRNCPWGQAGRSPAEAAADLKARLDRLERRLREGELAVEVTGYRLGVLRAGPLPAGRPVDLTGLRRRVEEQARDLLTVTGVEWVGTDRK